MLTRKLINQPNNADKIKPTIVPPLAFRSARPTPRTAALWRAANRTAGALSSSPAIHAQTKKNVATQTTKTGLLDRCITKSSRQRSWKYGPFEVVEDFRSAQNVGNVKSTCRTGRSWRHPDLTSNLFLLIFAYVSTLDPNSIPFGFVILLESIQVIPV